MRHILLVIFGLLLAGHCQAQRGMAAETVKVKLPRPDLFMQGLPFDFPFYIVADIPAEYETAELDYAIASGEPRKKWITFPGKVGKEVTVVDNSVSLYCDGIHPNMRYDFKFILRKKVAVDDASIAALKAKIAKKLIEFFESKVGGSISGAELTKLQGDIDKIVKDYVRLGPNDKLLFRDTKLPYTTDYSTVLGGSASVYNGYIGSKNASQQNVDGALGIKQAVLLMNSNHQYMDAQLAHLLYNIKTASAGTQELLKMPAAAYIEGFESYTTLDGLTLVKRMTADPGLYDDVLGGKLKILNGEFVACDAPDPATIDFINALFQKMDKGIFKDTVNKKEIVLFQKPNVKLLFAVHAYISEQMAEVRDYQQKINALQDRLPDVTANLVIVEVVHEQAISVPDVTTKETPYISAEGGIGYAPVFSSAFSYYGANFYLSPVNKKALLGSFKGWNKFTKMFCFQVGVAQLYSTRAANTFSILGNSASQDLLLGVGLRLGRVIKINAGVMPYRTNNDNPLSDNYDVRFSGYGTIGLDVNLLGAFDKVATLLSLK